MERACNLLPRSTPQWRRPPASGRWRRLPAICLASPATGGCTRAATRSCCSCVNACWPGWRATCRHPWMWASPTANWWWPASFSAGPAPGPGSSPACCTVASCCAWCGSSGPRRPMWRGWQPCSPGTICRPGRCATPCWSQASTPSPWNPWPWNGSTGRSDLGSPAPGPWLPTVPPGPARRGSGCSTTTRCRSSWRPPWTEMRRGARKGWTPPRRQPWRGCWCAPSASWSGPWAV